MSVRMALAKLCACTCGGALIGGGAVHVSEAPAAPYVKKLTKKNPVRARVVRKGEPARKIKRTRRTVTKTVTACQPTVVTIAQTPAPQPIPVPLPPYVPPIHEGGSVPVVIGGSGGYGGGFGGGFFGGFFGGSSGGSIVISSTSSGGSTSTSSGGSSTTRW